VPIAAAMRRAYSYALLLSLSLLGGCAGAPDVRVHASAPVMLDGPGYDYDAHTARLVQGALDLDVRDGPNTGTVLATAKDLFHSYEFRWVNFTGRQPYQGGGVVRDRDLWGSTGNGSSVFPRAHAYVAVFGTLEARMDGRVERDLSSLDDTMPAILFVSRGHYRDTDTHRVTTRDKSNPYDPARPDDFYENKIGAQATLLVFLDRGDLYRQIVYDEVQVTKA
jgi:hypothetical protein